MPRFLDEGIWENGYDDKHKDLVRSMQPCDRIAIKSSYTRKHDLPFDGRGNSVSVMAIGVLLHPSTGKSLHEAVVIQGHRIRFMTVDLTAAPSAIRAELLRVIDPVGHAIPQNNAVPPT